MSGKPAENRAAKFENVMGSKLEPTCTLYMLIFTKIRVSGFKSSPTKWNIQADRETDSCEGNNTDC